MGMVRRMNLKLLDRKIKKQADKLDALKQKKNQYLKSQEVAAQEMEPTKKSKKKKKESQNSEDQMTKIQYSYLHQNPIFYSERKSLKELLAADALDPNNYGYLKLVDAGKELYERSFYIDKMPRDANFADTFSALYNFPQMTSNTRIEPIPPERAVRLMDKQVWDLDTELAAAQKAGDRNRYRKQSQKMQDTESWARDLESGRNRLYDVSFLFSSAAGSQEEMERIGSDFHNIGLSKNMAIVSAYGVEPEAFKSAFPLNKVFKSKWGPVTTSTVKVHQMDAYSLATIFNHTRSNFYHKKGVYLGRNLSTGRPVTIDFYDPSLEAHNVIFAGKTGTGKSATIKEIFSRAADFGLKYCSIDTEAKGTKGEYSIMTERLGGVNYQVKVGSNVLLNLFEIGCEYEYDENTGSETMTLHLIEKISILKGVILAMIKFGKRDPSFKEENAMGGIIEQALLKLYEKKGIIDGQPESLYMTSSGYEKIRKILPTIQEFYIEILKMQKLNMNRNHEDAYSEIIDGMASYVKELYYVPGIVQVLSKAEYDRLPIDEDGRHLYEDEHGERHPVTVCRGVRAYFDGQSTIVADLDTPAINIDISQIPSNDLPIAMVIAANWCNENIIKKNSANPKRVQKRAILIDEVHRMFPYEELRRFLSNLYRSARKRYIAPVVSMQALADCKGYKETEDLVKQSPIIFLFRQARQDREYLESATCLTPTQIDRLLKLGGKSEENGKAAQMGQTCMIVNDHVTFVQVDYLTNSETEIVETSPAKILEHIRKRREREYEKAHQK